MLGKVVLASVLLAVPMVASSASFWVSGTITRTLTDHYYGQCMVHISTVVGRGCPANGWVSLDCSEKYFQGGPRKFSTAMVALTTGKKISLYVDNSKKHNGYCVARRLDM